MPRPVPDSTTGWWSIRIRMPDGKRRKFSLMKDPRWARGKKLPKRPPPEVEILARKYQDMDLQVRHGVDVSAAHSDDLKAFLAEYQTHYASERRPNSVRVLKQSVKHFLAWCEGEGVRTAQQVTATACENYLAARRKAGAAPATVALERGCLSPAWTRAVRARRLPENPWKLVAARKKGKVHAPEFWSTEELEKLIAASSGWVRDLILLGANTGARIDSLVTLTWGRVKWNRDVILFESKTGPYEVPMNAVARDVLQRMHATSKGDLVFPAGREPKKPRSRVVTYVAILNAVRRAGIPEKKRYNHLLRHTFASHAVMRGVPLAVVSKWLGHSSINMTMTYAHLSQEESQRQMAGFSLGADPPPDPSRTRPEGETTPSPLSG